MVASVPPPGDANWTPRKQHVAYNHVESFNLFLTHGLKAIEENLQPIDIEHPQCPGEYLRVNISDLKVHKPKKTGKTFGEARPRKEELYPSECREAMYSYNGTLTCRVQTQSLDIPLDLGEIPIMVGSQACHLNGLTPKQLVGVKEEAEEFGGVFIVGGNERVVRLLAMPRANYIIAIERPSFKNRGDLYTSYATQVRCMRSDLTAQTLTLHYRNNGTCFLRFAYYKTEYLIPMMVIAKALCGVDANDKFIFERFCDGVWDDTYTAERVKNMLETQIQNEAMPTQKHALSYLGKHFRNVMGLRKTMSDEEAGREMINQNLFVHCSEWEDKFGCMVMMFQKLLGLVRGTVKADNPDAFSMQEVLLPGQLYGAMIKDVLQENLRKLKQRVQMECRMRDKTLDDAISAGNFEKFAKETLNVSRDIKYFLSTGNVRSKTGLDLMQASGFTIMADKLNANRYLSHFRAIHRGQYFMEMKTTAVRKLLPETWGFLCPVHTPDGTPCGLLNHLAAQCFSVIRPRSTTLATAIKAILTDLNVDGVGSSAALLPGDEYVWVTLDGVTIGKVHKDRLQLVAERLRYIKTKGTSEIPNDLEIMCILPGQKMYAGLFLFSAPCRVVRPVRNLDSKRREYVGPLEQLFLNIAVTNDDLQDNHSDWPENQNIEDFADRENLPLKYSHCELHPAAMLSYLASMTPFSNHNQSPRNMYQCQMLKQTMGTPYLNNPHRTDNKSYKVYTPQAPMVRTQMYDQTDLNDHPNGTNAVVAVIAHTGYDMEDAMIINKGSMERGFKAGCVYKVVKVDCGGDGSARDAKLWKFSRMGLADDELPWIGMDGLPMIGSRISQGMPYCHHVKLGKTMETKLDKWKEEEDAFVDQVNIINGGWYGEQKLGNQCLRAVIKFRIPRNPNIGDKFASRHGQKGVLSMLWPHENMPFTGRGHVPDIMFNPHGFPSRMTVGMLIESIAGKAAAINGYTDANATTFRQYAGTYAGDNNEKDAFCQDKERAGEYEELKTTMDMSGKTAADYFGTALENQGFECLGTDEMYCGMYGEPMQVRIFMGVVYYQRLRHMVNDKAQVRATGPIDPMTRQPVKGRKRHGGIRFGEMERDSLLAHGTCFLLHDRLMRSSDFSVSSICPDCGSIIAPTRVERSERLGGPMKRGASDPTDVCRKCKVACKKVPMPYVFRYLAMELAAMNIDISMSTNDKGAVSLKPLAPIVEA